MLFCYSLTKFYKIPFEMRIICDQNSLISLCINGQTGYNKYIDRAIILSSKDIANAPEPMKLTERWLNEYFSGRKPAFLPPLYNNNLSPFAAILRDQMLKIPFGKTATYGEIAKAVSNITGKKPCARAIGQAVGNNPISIIVPCHRVIGANAKITGYNGGTDKKIALLSLEGVEL